MEDYVAEFEKMYYSLYIDNEVVFTGREPVGLIIYAHVINDMPLEKFSVYSFKRDRVVAIPFGDTVRLMCQILPEPIKSTPIEKCDINSIVKKFRNFRRVHQYFKDIGTTFGRESFLQGLIDSISYPE